MEVATSIASSALGARPPRTTNSMAWLIALANGRLSGISLSSESVTSWNCSATFFNLWASPPDSADQVSLALAMRLRACAIRMGSKRPKGLVA